MQASQSEDRDELPTKARKNDEKIESGFTANGKGFPTRKKTERNSERRERKQKVSKPKKRKEVIIYIVL